MKHIILLTLLLTLSLADKTVIKTITINQMTYPNKTYLEFKEIILKKAKKAAAQEIYGENLQSETVMVNGKVLDDVVRKQSGGIIHIKDEPEFKNGKNLGELEVTIVAYATDKDIIDASSKKEFKKTINNRSDVITSKEKIKKIKRGFYGQWNGFIMRSNGSSGDVSIEITNSGLVSINYNSLNCGGDLIIQEKTMNIVKFKEKLTYGTNECIDNHFISLKKLSNTQLLFMQFNEKNEEVAKGSLYRDE